MGVAKSTVIYTIKRFNDMDSLQSKKRIGRPKKFTDRDLRHTVKIIREDPSQSSKELADTININRIEPTQVKKNRRFIAEMAPIQSPICARTFHRRSAADRPPELSKTCE